MAIVMCLIIYGIGITLRVFDTHLLQIDIIAICGYLLSSMSFVLIVLNIGKIVIINNKLYRFLGGISLEIYLIHYLVFQILRSKYLFVNNDILFVLLTLFISIVVSFFMHKLFNEAFYFLQIGRNNKK